MATESRALVVVHQREPFMRGFGSFVVDSWNSRTILWSFVRKELLIRYRGSALGILWALVKPLTQLLIYGVVLGVFLGIGRSLPYFPLYIFTGLIIMGIFSESATHGATSIIRGAPLVKKVAFRRELLPIAAVGGALINSLFQLAVLGIGYLLTGSGPNWGSLGFVVPALLIVILFSTGTAILLSALNVYLRDVQFIVDVGLMVLFWMTPVLYSWSMVRDNLASRGMPSWIFEVYMLNPLANAVVAFREAMWPGIGTEQGASFVYFESMWDPRLWGMVGAGLLFVWLAQRVFQRMQSGFAAEL